MWLKWVGRHGRKSSQRLPIWWKSAEHRGSENDVTVLRGKLRKQGRGSLGVHPLVSWINHRWDLLGVWPSADQHASIVIAHPRWPSLPTENKPSHNLPAGGLFLIASSIMTYPTELTPSSLVKQRGHPYYCTPSEQKTKTIMWKVERLKSLFHRTDKRLSEFQEDEEFSKNDWHFIHSCRVLHKNWVGRWKSCQKGNKSQND